MPRPKQNAHLYELAKRGAEVQFREFLYEVKLLIDLFPHLRDSFDKDELPLNFIMAESSGAATKTSGRRKRRKPMSAAAKKAVSDRMKKFWAGKRKGAAKV